VSALEMASQILQRCYQTQIFRKRSPRKIFGMVLCWCWFYQQRKVWMLSVQVQWLSVRFMSSSSNSCKLSKCRPKWIMCWWNEKGI